MLILRILKELINVELTENRLLEENFSNNTRKLISVTILKKQKAANFHMHVFQYFVTNGYHKNLTYELRQIY